MVNLDRQEREMEDVGKIGAYYFVEFPLRGSD